MTRLAYNIKTNNGTLLKDKETEETVLVANWKVAKALAKMVDGQVVPVYIEHKTY